MTPNEEAVHNFLYTPFTGEEVFMSTVITLVAGYIMARAFARNFSK